MGACVPYVLDEQERVKSKTETRHACTVVYMSEERYMSEETHTEKLVLAVTKTYDYCDMSQETLK